MRRTLLTSLCLATFATTSMSLGTSAATSEVSGPQAKPRPATEPRQTPPPQPASRGRQAEPSTQGQPARQAVPRPPGPPEEKKTTPPPRRVNPPSRVIPPRYYVSPRPYYFPPISLHRDFYYHPYFGFYYGPYYGPFYPYPGPYFGPPQYTTSAVRLKVKPVTAQVYVDGYYAGAVDDFDGLFQRLYLPAGQHEIEFYLAGYRSVRQALYLSPGDTRDVVLQMEPLRPGERPPTLRAPALMPPEPDTDPLLPPGDRPVSPFGILTLRVEPTDAQIVLDNEVWLGTEDRTEFVLHVPAGAHTLEVRKTGYQTFKAGIELSEGGRTRLNVLLVR